MANWEPHGAASGSGDKEVKIKYTNTLSTARNQRAKVNCIRTISKQEELLLLTDTEEEDTLHIHLYDPERPLSTPPPPYSEHDPLISGMPRVELYPDLFSRPPSPILQNITISSTKPTIQTDAHTSVTMPEHVRNETLDTSYEHNHSTLKTTPHTTISLNKIINSIHVLTIFCR